MKMTLFSLLLLFPSLPELLQSVQAYWQQEQTARLETFAATEQKTWVKFMPSFGMTYDLQGRPRPSASFNLNKFYDSAQEKEHRQVQQEAIRKEVQLLKEENERQVTELFLNYQDQLQLHQFSIEQAAIDSILFSFTEQAYHQPVPEIPPSEYYQKKKNYLSVQKSLLIEQMNLRRLEREILTAAHWRE